MRGQIFDIEGKRFFTMGGANSVDKMHRRESVSWWPAEMPSFEEYEEAIYNLDAVSNKVDIILSHCAPDTIQTTICDWYQHDKLTNFLEIVRQTVEFGWYYFGHYHIDKDFLNYKATCLYNNIIEI